MKQTFYTKTGKHTRELTQGELIIFASEGNPQAKKELSKIKLKDASTIEDKINIILQHLDLK